MAVSTFNGEERTGLALAIALHAGLLALLLLGPRRSEVLPAPERISVTISDDVGVTSTSPEPAARAAPDVAPQLGEAQPEPAPARPPPEPEQPVARPQPQAPPQPAPQPRPLPRAPAARPVTAPPKAQPSRRPAAHTSPPAERTLPVVPRRAGATHVGADFLKGVAGTDPQGSSRNQPAAAIGPAVRSSLSSAISRQLKPHWAAPQGADAELLITVLSFDLDQNGRLTGKPRVVRQDGITDANRAQSARHAEQAVRAVELSAPFELPAQYYPAWRTVVTRFDRKLSQ